MCILRKRKKSFALKEIVKKINNYEKYANETEKKYENNMMSVKTRAQHYKYSSLSIN